MEDKSAAEEKKKEFHVAHFFGSLFSNKSNAKIFLEVIQSDLLTVHPQKMLSTMVFL